MRLTTLLAGLLAFLISNVSATALTYNLAAHEKACFYAEASQVGEKMAFYFAVCYMGFFNTLWCSKGWKADFLLSCRSKLEVLSTSTTPWRILN